MADMPFGISCLCIQRILRHVVMIVTNTILFSSYIHHVSISMSMLISMLLWWFLDWKVENVNAMQNIDDIHTQQPDPIVSLHKGLIFD